MNEAETRAELIDPQLKASGWGVIEDTKILREYNITAGRIQMGGKRAKPVIADYVLVYKGVKLAVVEAKSEELEVGEGVMQAKEYAIRLQLKYTYAANGKAIYQIAMETATEGLVPSFPTPEELWHKTFAKANEWRDTFNAVPFELIGGSKGARYYQENAVTKTMEAIATGKNRILLTLATGTGKTFIAFQIAWKLFQTRWTVRQTHRPLGAEPVVARRPRILFLADRNILADQAFNSFSAFQEDALVRINPKEIRKKGSVPTNGSIFFTIFQTFMSGGSTSSPTTVKDENIEFEEIAITDFSSGFMYILQCNDGSFYTGSTKDLARRIEQHKNGEGAEYTKLHSPVRLVYYETFERVDLAFKREKQVQKWSRAKKIALIKQDIELLKRLSKNNTENEPKSGELTEPYFGEYPADFFDFIIIDECHRGGANDEGNWRKILEYFAPAVQLGLTATPKRKDNVDTYAYFGEPIYVYSLKEGINDGFLTPFKVKRIQTTLDEYVYTPDDDVIEGEIDTKKEYKESDFNRIIEIKEREQKRVQLFMEASNPNEKAIVFCANQQHAAVIRDLINQYSKSTNPNYCVRVTANDGAMGEQYLKEFQDNEKTIPTILTTSQKLSTGVDARNVRNVVLLRPVNSMIEFKQIVGRGTRMFDGKDYFTIYDFVGAYKNFLDPEWDGEPIEPEPTEPKTTVGDLQPGVVNEPPADPIDRPKREKVKVKLADGKERSIKSMTSTSFWSADGQPISVEQFMKNLYGKLPEFFSNEEELRTIWSNPITRKSFLEKLDAAGYGKDTLLSLQELIEAENSDLFDVLEYIAYNITPIPRLERVALAKESFLNSLDAKHQEFLNFVLSKYVETGVDELDQEKLPQLLMLKYQSISDATETLGGIDRIRDTFIGFQKFLYRKSA